MEEELKEKLRDEIDRQLEDIGHVDGGSEDEQRIIHNICNLTASLDKLNGTEMDVFDKQERRIADEEKNRRMHELEEKKSKLSPGRVIFEMSKIMVPGLLSWIAYDRALNKVFKFEETGRIVSDGGRMASRLPNLFGIWKR